MRCPVFPARTWFVPALCGICSSDCAPTPTRRASSESRPTCLPAVLPPVRTPKPARPHPYRVAGHIRTTNAHPAAGGRASACLPARPAADRSAPRRSRRRCGTLHKGRSAWRSKRRRPHRPPLPGRRAASYPQREWPESAARRNGRPCRRYWPRAHRPPRYTGRGLRWSRAVLPPSPSAGSGCRHSGTARLPFRPRCSRPHLGPATARRGSVTPRLFRKSGNCIPAQRRQRRMPERA